MPKYLINIVLLIAATVGVALAVATRQRNVALQLEITLLEEEAAASKKSQRQAAAQAVKPVMETVPVMHASGRTANDDATATAKAEAETLRNALAAKEAVLANLQQQMDSRRSSRDDKSDRDKGDGKKGFDRGRSFFESLKEKDPERYQQIRTYMAEAQDRLRQRTTKQDEFFAEFNVDNMTEVQRMNHIRVVEGIAQIQMLATQMEVAMENGESTREYRHEMRDLTREIRPLMDEQREYALQDFARTLGYEGEGAEEFSNYLQYVMEMTSLNSMMGGPPRGSGGGWR